LAHDIQKNPAIEAMGVQYANILSAVTVGLPILQGIGTEVVAYDIQKNPAVEAMGVQYVSIEDALPWADVVSVHVPLLKSTHHFHQRRQVRCI
jgi:D-lactate dehydrogenase